MTRRGGDAARRAHERRWRASADPDDRAAWLAASVRAGALAPLHLAVAGACGDEGARRAAGLPPPPRRAAERLRALFEAGGSWGLVQLAVAAVEDLVARVPAARIPPMARGIPFDRHGLDFMVEQARAWLACPCATHGVHVPALFPLHEHELAVDLAWVLHQGAQGEGLRVETEGARPVSAAETLLGQCARLAGTRPGTTFRRAGRLVVARLLAALDDARTGGPAPT